MPLPPLLLCTDFDGTIATPFDETQVFAPDFFEWIEKARRFYNVTWVIATGRDWPALATQLHLRHPAFWPNWVVVVERYAFAVRDYEPVSLEPWNSRCAELHKKLFDRSSFVFEKIRAMLADLDGLEFIVEPDSPIGMIAYSEYQADEISRILKKVIPKNGDLMLMRNSVYFRFAHKRFHKGTGIGAIAQTLKIDPTHCFIAGDHYNDMHMLDRAYGHKLACPGNSISEVKHLVKKQGGYIATKSIDAGIVEALQHYFPEV